MPEATKREWLDNKHPIYVANVEEWKENERRLRGGRPILTELRRFEWETDETPQGAFAKRSAQATYVNFPEMLVTVVAGHILQNMPAIDEAMNFGTLGTVRRPSDSAIPSRAEQVYYNIDGVGSDGSQLPSYVTGAIHRACATGHRWHYIDAPREAPQNRQRELDGLRPYIVEFSPISVPDWHYEHGVLQYAIVRVPIRRPRIANNAMEGADNIDAYMLLVKRGCRVFDGEDATFAEGGAFFYGPDKERLPDLDVKFDGALGGEIPFFPLFGMRDRGTSEIAAMSRPLTTDLGNCAVSYMNLSSAADFDAWDAAKSISFLLNVDQAGFNLAVDMIKSGSRLVPLKSEQNSGGTSAPVQVVDSGAGGVSAEVFDKRLSHKLMEAKMLALREAVGTPDASGASKQAGFDDVKKPRLISIATEVETWLNIVIYFFEKRFGEVKPTGSVIWDKEFDLLALQDRIEKQFSLEKLSGLRSSTLGSKAMAAAAVENGLVADDAEAETVANEYKKAAEDNAANRNALQKLQVTAGIDPDDQPQVE